MSIHLLADQGEKAGVSQMIANGAQVNEPDGAGETPLHYAAIKGHAEVVVILISSGADPNIKSDRGTTPLHDAAKHGKLDAVTCLVDSNANTETLDFDNKTPIHHAIENGHFKVVNKLLEKNPTQQINNVTKDGSSPLHLAATKGSLPIIKALIEKGARLDIRDQKGNTALSCIPLVEKKPAEPQPGQRSLLNDIKSLFAAANGRLVKDDDAEHAQSYSDVTFVVEGSRVHGHRSIIAARCARLGKLLRPDTPKDEIEVRDINPSVFSDVLEWIYSDDVQSLRATDPNLVHLLKLFQAADRFALRSLKSSCEAVLAHNTSTSNVGSVFAELRQMTPPPQSLFQQCAQILVRNWNLFSGTKTGQDLTKEDVISLCEQLTIAEPKEVAVPEHQAPAKSVQRHHSPKPQRTKSSTQQQTPTAPLPASTSKSRGTPATPQTPITPSQPAPSAKSSSGSDDRMSDKNLRTAKSITSHIMKNKSAWPFNQPVDPVALGVPDYFDIIKHPMDLATVKQKLDSNKYPTVSAFAGDMRLVFDNAMRYNAPESGIFLMAEGLLKLFNSKFSSTAWERSGGGGGGGIDYSSPIPSPSTTGSTKKRKASHNASPTGNGIPSPVAREHVKSEHSARSAVKPEQSVAAKPRPSPPREMTFEEKKALGDKMGMLSEEQLGQMVNILSGKPAGEQEDIEIDMNELDEVTLRKLQAYVNECFANNDKSKRAKTSRKGEDEDVVVDDH